MTVSDTSMLTDMMKGNLTNVLPMILIGGWINWAFSGFVISELCSCERRRLECDVLNARKWLLLFVAMQQRCRFLWRWGSSRCCREASTCCPWTPPGKHQATRKTAQHQHRLISNLTSVVQGELGVLVLPERVWTEEHVQPDSGTGQRWVWFPRVKCSPQLHRSEFTKLTTLSTGSCRPVAGHAGADDGRRHGDASWSQQGFQGQVLFHTGGRVCRTLNATFHRVFAGSRASGRRWRSWNTSGRWRTWRRSWCPEISTSGPSWARRSSPPCSRGQAAGHRFWTKSLCASPRASKL